MNPNAYTNTSSEFRVPWSISNMPITELENNPESVWVKVFKTKLLIMWRVGTGNLVVLVKTFNCSEISFTISGTNTRVKIKKLPSVHVLGDFNFRDIDWPDRLNKSGSGLSQSERQMLIDIMNDHGLEQLMHFPTREKKNTLDLLLTFLPGQFQDIHSPDKLSDHGIVAGTLTVVTPPIKKTRRKVYTSVVVPYCSCCLTLVHLLC